MVTFIISKYFHQYIYTYFLFFQTKIEMLNQDIKLFSNSLCKIFQEFRTDTKSSFYTFRHLVGISLSLQI